MTEQLLKLFQYPEIKKFTNCVCFAIGNPFAGIFRGALCGDIVNEAIEKVEETNDERVNDIHIWYGNGHHHFAVEFVKEVVITQHGRGGPIRAYKIDVAMQMGGDYYPKYKRVRSFHLPVRPSCLMRVDDIRVLEDSCNDEKCHATLRELFKKEAGEYFPGLDGIKDRVYQKYREWIVSPKCPYGKKYPSIPIGEIYESNISRDNESAVTELLTFQQSGLSGLSY